VSDIGFNIAVRGRAGTQFDPGYEEIPRIRPRAAVAWKLVCHLAGNGRQRSRGVSAPRGGGRRRGARPLSHTRRGPTVLNQPAAWFMLRGTAKACAPRAWHAAHRPTEHARQPTRRSDPRRRFRDAPGARQARAAGGGAPAGEPSPAPARTHPPASRRAARTADRGAHQRVAARPLSAAHRVLRAAHRHHGRAGVLGADGARRLHLPRRASRPGARGSGAGC
jgi:hypothetical protein